MCLRFLTKFKIFLLIVWIQNASTLRLKSGKHSIKDKDHKASRRNDVNDYHNSSLASRRSTYRINMPMRVAKLILPQISNKDQETIIRIYPDKSAQMHNQTGSNYMLSLSYKKLNDDCLNTNKIKIGRRACYYGQRPGCCSTCCPGSMCNPSMLPGTCVCCPRPVCPRPPCCCCCCCGSSSPPPPPPPPKKPPPPPCPMVCLPCNPCPRPPCPCRPICIPRPCHPPCRIPAPPITGPQLNGPCIAAPPVMGPCHPPCLPQRLPFIPTPPRPAPPVLPINQPVVVDHPLKGPAPIYIDQCHDVIPECRAFAKSGMCNHPSPFHSIKQIRKICAFSCGICNDYDENAALLRRHTHSRIHVRPVMRAKLNRVLEQIIRNKDLEGHSTLEPQQNKAVTKEDQTGEKKSHDAIDFKTQSGDFKMLHGGSGQDESVSGSGGSGGSTNGLEEIT